MKYLKTYEDLTDKVIKRYCIWHDLETNKLEILKLLKTEHNKDEKFLSKIYYTFIDLYYISENLELQTTPGTTQFIVNEKNTNKNVIYSTDNLDDCKIRILEIAQAIKYNI